MRYSHTRTPRVRRLAMALLATTIPLTLAACSSDDPKETSSSAASDTQAGEAAAPSGTLRLGYFGNVTHAPAVIGVEEGIFEDALGADVDLELSTFNSGTEAIEALFAGAIDATFVGPNPAINGYAQSLSEGGALRIVSGTTSGGASLVVRDGIDTPEDLAGAKLSTPSLGNSQDVALRAWLADEGYETDQAGGGDVSIAPQDNADTLTAFVDGAIDGAWVPEPWASRLVLEGGGYVLVNEADLWPGGAFVTTHLVVATKYLDDHPVNVRALVSGLLDSLDYLADEPDQAKTDTNDGIEAITTKRLEDATIDAAWGNLTFTYDPIASSLTASKNDAVKVGLLEDVDLAGIYDLSILNALLTERGLAEVAGS